MGVSVADKISPFSTPTKPSPAPKLTNSSVEAKENRFTTPSSANQMKSLSKKNFMLPTISAASKTVANRKKVLVERNDCEATEPTCAKLQRRSSSFDLKQASVDLGDSLTSSINGISSVEDGEDATKLKPYDPVLNYCSPRPKFLLYKPDRRSEILRRYEMIDGTSSESESSGEVENVNHEEEVVAQHDEDAGGSVKDMNEKIEECEDVVGKKSEDHYEVIGNIEEQKEVHESIENPREEIKENHVQGAEIGRYQNATNQLELETRSTMQENETSEIKSDALLTKDDDGTSIQCMEVEDEDEEEWEFEEEDEVERCWSFKRFLKFWLVIVVLGLSTLYLSSMNSVSVGLDLYRAPFIHENATGSFIQVELSKMGYEEASHRIKHEIIISDPDNDYGETIEMNNEASHVLDLGIVIDDARLTVVSTADKVETAEDDMTYVSTQILINHHVAGTGNAGDIEGEEFVYLEETAKSESSLPSDRSETENHVVETEFLEPLSEDSEAAYVEMDVSAGTNNYHTQVNVDETAVFECSAGEELEVGKDWGVEHVTKSVAGMLNNLEKFKEDSEMVMVDDGLLLRYFQETNKAAIIGVLSALLLAFVGLLGFRKLKRANKTLQDEANRGQHFVKNVDKSPYSSYAKPGADEFCASSYSLRTDYVDNYDDSTNSFSQRNIKTSASHQRSQRRSLEKELPTSSIDSPSYGSFTTEMMFRKKEEARGVEKIVVTPVRRSSRIQSRMTPGASQ